MKKPNHNPEIPDSRDQFQLLIETLPISLSIVTPDGKILYVNPKCREVFGISQNELIPSNQAIMYWVNPEDRKNWLEQITGKGIVQNFEMHLRTKAGIEIWVLGSGIFIQYQNQTCVLSTHQDVTDRIVIEKKLHQLTDEYQKVFLGTQSALFLVEVCGDGKFRYLRTNNAHQKTTGILLENISGKTPQELLGNTTGDKITENYQKCVLAQKPVSYEEELDLPSGKKFWATTLSPVSENGKVIYIVGSSNDITELKQTGQALRNSEENLRHFFDANIDFLWVLDLQARILAVNQTVKNRLGYTNDEIIGKSILLVHPESRRLEAQDIVAAMLQGKRNSCPVPLVTKKGSEIPVETFIVKGKWNNEPALFGISKDISHLKLSEEKFKKAFHTSPNIIGLSDLETGEYIEVNNTFYQILEYTKEEIGGKKVKDLVRLDKDFREAAIKKLKTEGAIQNQETVIYTKNGRPVHVLMSAEIIKLQDKQYNLTTAVDIGYLKKAEKALAESESNYRNIFENAPVGIFRTHSSGKVLLVNQTMANIVGVETIDETIAWYNNLGNQLYADPQRRNIFLQIIAENGAVNDFEYLAKTKCGRTIWLSMNARISQKNSDGSFIIEGFTTDITARKQAEINLRESEERFKALHNASFGGISLHKNGIIISCNQGLCDLTGYSMNELIGMNNLLLSPEGLRDMIKEKIRDGYEKPYESLCLRKDGTEIPVRIEGRNIPYKGEMIRVTEFRDITEQKRNEAELIAKENRWRSIIKTSPDGIVITSPEGTILEASDMAYKMYGYENSDEVIGKNIIDFVDEEYRQKAMMEIEEMLTKKNETGGSEYKLIRKDGTTFYAEINAEMIYDEQQNPLHIIFIERDITERKQTSVVRLIQYNIARTMLTAKSLEELASFIRYELNRVLDTSNFFIATYNPKTDRLKKVIFNDEKDDFSEWNASQSISGQVAKLGKEVLLDKEKEAAFAREHNIRLTGSPPEAWLGVPIMAGDKPFGVMTIQSYNNPGAYNENSVALMKMVAHEIGVFVERQNLMTDLLSAKEKAEENDRLKSAFLANMSHEIRTPMNGILGFTDLLKEPGITDDQRNRFISIIEKSGKRLLNLINDLIDISKIEAGQMKLDIQKYDFDEIIRSLYRFFQPETTQKNIELLLNCEKFSDTTIYTDHEKFTSILTNLIKNAIKFTEKGRIEIGCKKYGQFIRFHVKDTGRGIPADKKQLIFERFGQADTSLIRNYEGAGLGLSIAKAYTEMLGGTIGMKSQPGKGSEFYFTHPLEISQTSKKNTSPEIETIDDKEYPFTDLKILVAEDDANSIQYFKIRLKSITTNLHLTNNGRDAVNFISSNPDTDLVLMDIKMPKLDGLQATKEIRKFNTTVVIIAQSAYASESNRQEAIDAGCNDYLGKPIKKNDLMNCIAKWFTTKPSNN
ncbi:MAG: PAS domain S-box protein [Bacteroidales bacterium]|nr:PAS domain S-box protein [Bacteroidales bacterium]